MVQPRGRALPPWVTSLVGLGLVVVSAACVAVFSVVARAARAFPGRPPFPAGHGGGLDPLVQRLGALLAAGGLALVAWGIAQQAGVLLAARRRARASDPWLADYPWSRAGATDESPREGRAAIGRGLVMLALDAALSAAILPELDGGARVAVLAVAALLGVAALVAVAWGAHRLARRARHGRLELRFQRFPFFLGGSLEAELVRPVGGPALGPIEATLRCVQEVRYVERSGDDTGWAVDRTVVWSETRRVQGVARRATRVAIQFELPPALGLSTELSANPPRYWELEVASATAGLDLGATFLVPVYAAPLETIAPPRWSGSPALPPPGRALDRGRRRL